MLVERSLDLPVAQLAAWYAGAAFLTLDPALPTARLREMVNSAGVGVLVGGSSDVHRVPAGLPVVTLEAASDSEPRAHPVAADDLAYVIYTSGSTGRPKAVAVTHANVAAVYRGWVQRYALDSEDRVLQLASIGFDVATGDFVRMAFGGARLVLPTRDELVDPVALDELMRREAISYLEITPSLLRAMCAGLGEVRPVPSLRCLVVGGERFEVADLRAAWRLLGANGQLFNSYGVTETTIDTTAVELARDDRYPDGVPLGVPFAGTRLDVLDSRLAAVASDVAGEAYIGGDYVARGYLGAPAATAERFVPDPAGPPGARMFRTGDRMRRTQANELQHLGRADDQVKISGVRVDLAEIDRALTALPTVAAAACVVADAATARRIVAHVVASPGRQPTTDAIRRALSKTLPAVMVPADLMVHDRLPMSTNGKIDRAALTAEAPAPAGATPAPGGTMADRIAALMSALLGAPVGTGDDFFRSGGSSVLATVLLGRLRADFGLALPHPGALWEYSTPRRLAAALVATDIDTPRATGAEVAPLSPAQRGLWVAAQLRPDDPSATVCVGLTLAGEPDVEQLGRALRQLAARHPALRTVIRLDHTGEPFAHVLAEWPGRLEVRGGSVDPVWLDEPWDLEQGPLFRAVFTRTPDGGQLTLAGSHLILDGESIRIVLAELGALGRSGPLPPPPALTPADVATWQTERANGAGLAHWRSVLAGAPGPVPAPRRTRPKSVRTRHRRRIDVDTTRRLDEAGRRHGTSLFSVLLAGWLTVQRGWQGSEDVVVGVPFGDRWIPGTEAMVGFFVDTVALRVNADPSSGVPALLARVHDATMTARRYRDVPFTDVVHALGRSGSEARLFGSWFNYLGDADIAPDLPGVTVRIADPPLLGGLFDVNVYVERSDAALHLQLVAGPDGPDESHAAALLDQFAASLATLAAGHAPSKSAAAPHRTHAALPPRGALRARLAGGLARRGDRPCVSDPRPAGPEPRWRRRPARSPRSCTRRAWDGASSSPSSGIAPPSSFRQSSESSRAAPRSGFKTPPCPRTGARPSGASRVPPPF